LIRMRKRKALTGGGEGKIVDSGKEATRIGSDLSTGTRKGGGEGPGWMELWGGKELGKWEKTQIQKKKTDGLTPGGKGGGGDGSKPKEPPRNNELVLRYAIGGMGWNIYSNRSTNRKR